MDFTDLSIIGHYKGGQFLSDVSYSQIAISSIQVIVTRGMAGAALSAFCSTAYGAKNFKLVGIYLQVGLVFCSMAALILAPLWIWGGNILHGLIGASHMTDDAAFLVDEFLRLSLIWILPSAWQSCFNTYLMSQSIIYPQMICAIIGCCCNIGFNFLFVYDAGVGYAGSPLATGVTRWLVLCATVAIVHQQGLLAKNGTWGGWSLQEATKPSRAKEYLVQALPLALGGMLEEYMFQTIAVFAGQLGADAVGTHNATMTTISLLSSAFYSVGGATATRIGHHLGNRNIDGARCVIKMACLATLGWGAMVALGLTIFGDDVGALYSSDHKVWKLANEISSVVATGYLALAIFSVLIAVLESTGKGPRIAICFIVGTWFVGVPLSRFLSYSVNPDALSWWPGRVSADTGPDDYGLGLLGLWLGILAGYSTTMALAGAFASCGSWKQIVEDAARRAEVSDGDARDVPIADEDRLSLQPVA
jgi:MATE family multidrug resistance protein